MDDFDWKKFLSALLLSKLLTTIQMSPKMLYVLQYSEWSIETLDYDVESPLYATKTQPFSGIYVEA